MNQKDLKSEDTELEIAAPTGAIALKGQLGNLHQDTKKIHELLDLLGLPKGTEVKVTHKIGSVIVR